MREIIVQVRQGAMEVGDARSTINDMTMRQNEWTLGAYCASYCRVVTGHHSLEDEAIFPHLRAATGLAPVIDRLEDEHLIIHEVLEGVDAALVRFILQPDDFSELQEAVDVLTDTLLSHLSYEERELVDRWRGLASTEIRCESPVVEPVETSDGRSLDAVCVHRLAYGISTGSINGTARSAGGKGD